MGDPDRRGGNGRTDDAESDREDEGDDHADDRDHAESDRDRDHDDPGDRYGEAFVPDDGRDADDGDSTGAAEPEAYESLREELDDLRADITAFEDEIEDRTVHREEIEDDLRAYVRRRFRRGHARGWGPYLVLLYGTAMTIGAFVELSGVWAILAMVVIWLSTLGLYVLMVLFGLSIAALSAPGRAMATVRGIIDTLRDVRS